MSDVLLCPDAAANADGASPLGEDLVCGVVGLQPAILAYRGWVGLGNVAPSGSLVGLKSVEAVVWSSIAGVAARGLGGRVLEGPGCPVAQVVAVVGRKF